MFERHAVLMMAYNNLELTKQAFASIIAQDIGALDIYLVDNGSSDGTWEWMLAQEAVFGVSRRIIPTRFRANRSPVTVGNEMCSIIFKNQDKFLGVSNDVILPSNFYRLANQWPRGFVCASMTSDKNFSRFERASAVNECTPMAVMLVRKWAHDALIAKDGYFLDEGYFHYASDCDLALRMAACGIRGVQLDIQYYHYGSASWRLNPDGQKQIDQANADRAYFVKKWGFPVDALEYGACAADINFRALAKTTVL